MKRYTIEQKFKSAAAFLVILILFPYIVSVFVNGVDPEETTNENFYIRVKASEEEEADGIAEVEWNEYLTGVLAKDVPADTETEALKAQAVLVRTQISRALQRTLRQKRRRIKSRTEPEMYQMLFWRSIICRRRKCRINGLPMNIKSDMKNTEMP